jgi:hypothetical protein
VDAFSFGKPAKGRAARSRTAPAAARVAPRLGKPAMVIGASVVAIALAFGLFQVVKGGGEAVVNSTTTDLQQADAARDVSAQTTATNAQLAAKTAFTESNSYAQATSEALAKIEPSFRYVSAASTGPSVVSVATAPTEVGLAVMSESGTCFYVHLSDVGVDAYGSGTRCTGTAALSATGTSF